MNSPTPVIQIENLAYAYGRAEAVHDVSLKVQPGRCYGLFGRNGAGKTTTMKCLLNLLRPQRGQVRVFGLDPARAEVAVKGRLAYVPDQVVFYPWMSVRETLDYLASFRERWNRKTEQELLERFRLDPGQRTDDLSKGQRTQVALIAAICPETDLLVLDEPTSGLDPIVRREFIETVIGAYQEGNPGNRAIFVSTHLITEFEGLIDEFTIIDQSLEFGDEVSGDKNRAVARIALLVGADHRLDELTADDGVQARRRFVEHQQVRLRADRRDQRDLSSLAFREIIGALGRIKPETLEQLLLRLPVPALPKRRQVVERLANAHPGIKHHLVRHVSQPALHGDFGPGRIEAEYSHLPALRAQQIEQTLHRGRLARAVAPEKSVTSPGLHLQAQVVNGLRASVSVGEIFDLDGRSGRVHGCSILLMVFVGAPFVVEHSHSLMNQFKELGPGHLQRVCLYDGLVDLLDQELAPDFLAQCRVILFQKTAPPRQRLDHAQAFQFGISFGDRVAVDPKLHC